MKKQTLILAILMVLSVPAFTQWYQIYGSYPSIRKVFTLDKDHAYIVGHMGSFSRTTDGGNNWVDISTNCLEELLDVQFLNPSTGYICGSGGTLMKTIDGGDNWTFCNTGTVKEIISLRFSDEMNGFLSVRTGQNTGNIFRTTDGGITFTQCSVPLAEFLSISLIGNDTCFVSATGSFGNKVFRTYDGGTTWNEVFFSSINSFRVLKSFPNGKIYACAFSERMYFSNDFGNSWDSLLYQEENQMCLDASFPTSDIIFTAGFDPMQSAGYLYYSQNEGQTWSYNLFDPSLCTVSVIIDDAHDTVGFAGSQGGNLYRLSPPDPGA